MEELLEKVVAIARKAGAVVMEIYDSEDFGVQTKEDNSPLTKADLSANKIIEDELRKISDYPILSEEGLHNSGGAHNFWLIDPIDGTKEFINRNGEFSICIGLVSEGRPALGVVYAPAQRTMCFGSNATGAYKQTDGKPAAKISAEFKGRVPTVVASRSHLNEETKKFLAGMGEHRTITTGSVALKICLLAEGKAKLFPRMAPTSLWDTAAAEAILRAAGGMVTDTAGNPLPYKPEENILNPFFIAKTKD